MNCAPALVGVLVACVASAGCGNDCANGDGYCDGNHLVECEPSNDNVYSFMDQGACAESTCVEAQYEGQAVATCSTSGMPDPRCIGGMTIGFYVCADPSTVLYCEFGYSRTVELCGSGTTCSGSAGPGCH